MKNYIVSGLIFTVLLTFCKPGGGVTERTDYGPVSRVDSGRPVAVMLTAYSTTLLADGNDSTLLRICVTDSAGREISSAANDIRIYLDGDASIKRKGSMEAPLTAVDTGGLEYIADKLENGLAWYVFRSGGNPDKVRVEVRSGTLWPGSHEIHTISPDIELLSPSRAIINAPHEPVGRMIGADISFLPQFEARGRKYYEDGQEKDVVKILSDHGFNYIRLRLFVNPENENGYSPGKGFCGLMYTLKMAQRVKDAGMKILLNFHYSDYWADPQQQNKPGAWASLDFDTLKDSLYHYTASVLQAFNEQGTPVDMVQVGNEINHGLLWPDGHISNPDQLADLLIAGTEAVKSVDKKIPVMMHVALGGQNQEAVFWFNNMMARGVKFDIMGISYYPRWHGTLNDLQYNLNDLVKRYDRPVNVVEYSNFREEIHEIVFSLPDGMGKGTCIWEPIGFRGRLFNRQGEMMEGMELYDKLNDRYLKEN